MAWNDLTLSDKARMMELAVKSGITNLDDIQEVYNTFASGGPKEQKKDNPAEALWNGDYEWSLKREEEAPQYKDKYDRISNSRYESAYNALRNRGYHGFDADRLARILATQSIHETGWVDADSLHNYAGYLDAKGKKIKYASPEAFWDTHINNLSNRWPNWDKAMTIEEYFNTINSANLKLDTKEKFNAYNKKHRDNPAYIYAPDWENTNYLKRMLSIDKRASKNYPVKLGPIFD